MLIKNATTLPCVGCSGEVTFTPEGERPTFFHTLPYCDRFNSVNTVDQLLQYFRECSKLGPK